MAGETVLNGFRQTSTNVNTLFIDGNDVTPGTVIANGATNVTVANTAVTANTIVLYGLKTASGTVGAMSTKTITPGVGFAAASQASDTSTYTYRLIG